MRQSWMTSHPPRISRYPPLHHGTTFTVGGGWGGGGYVDTGRSNNVNELNHCDQNEWRISYKTCYCSLESPDNLLRQRAMYTLTSTSIFDLIDWPSKIYIRQHVILDCHMCYGDELVMLENTKRMMANKKTPLKYFRRHLLLVNKTSQVLVNTKRKMANKNTPLECFRSHLILVHSGNFIV